MPRIIQVDPTSDSESVIQEAADLILSGGLVAFPTESFYGLGVNALDEKAIRRLLQVKKRGEGHPILILIHTPDVLQRYVSHVPDRAQQLIKEFWPGGLTLLFEAGPSISPLLTAGTGKIGIRLSSHPVPRELGRLSGVPVTGTSANISGEPPCKNAKDVLSALETGIDMILDAGATEGKAGSTLLDVTVHPPKILREGMITCEQLAVFIS